jgi:FAD/FMN-containing dehydrogenase/uncharacterized membrane protein YhaH (DUF805 family)
MLRFFFGMTGRIARGGYVGGTLAVALVFGLGFVLLDDLAGPASTWLLYPFAYAAWLALAIKRCHDLNKSGAFLVWMLVPLAGLVYVLASLCFRRGTDAENAYGPQPVYHGLDHYRVPDPKGATPSNPIVDDVTQMNPIAVAAAVAPVSLDELVEVVRRSRGPLSIGGGRFSMGGQTASPSSLHIDMRRMNRVIELSPIARTIRVQAGIRWCDVQRFIDTHDLSVKIMQTYANFTVGGSLSVNCHGRYVGLGPLILAVRSITIVLASGECMRATPTENASIFFGAIGGYGGLGVIAEAELELDDNCRVERITETLPASRYVELFKQKVRSSDKAVFHNADLYPPDYTCLRSVTWEKTDRYVTLPLRIMRVEPSYVAFRYLFWTVSELPFGAWRRRRIFEPWFYAGQSPVHWRNYEAGYDVAELEPTTRTRSSYVLLEYFVPVARFDEFVPKMGEIFRRFSVNVLNVSVRHAMADSGSMLAWAREEVFAFVIYYKQAVDKAARAEVGVWTRALVDAALECGGSYYLPYQPHATRAQFHRAYPRADELFALKAEIDPDFRFRNAFWDTYYAPTLAETEIVPRRVKSEFHAVFDDVVWRDRFYLFLQNIYHLFPEGAFHALIHEATGKLEDDEAIYRRVQAGLPSIAPALAPLRYALPALAKQKEEMKRQTLALLGAKTSIDGYLEIGSTGRYVASLRSGLRMRGPVYLIGEEVPGTSPVDIVERGGIAQVGAFFPLADYAPIEERHIPSGSLDLVTCYIGLHHVPRAKLDDFIRSIARVLRKDGVFVLRDHDAGTDAMKTFVSLVHTVFNAGLMAPWSVDRAELRFFTGADEIARIVEAHGLIDAGERIFQARDPSRNALMAFRKE